MSTYGVLDGNGENLSKKLEDLALDTWQAEWLVYAFLDGRLKMQCLLLKWQIENLVCDVG